jgi:hypothetical protein
MSFDTLGLPEALTRAVRDAGYEQPTDVQSRAIPPALAGTDLRVSSSTGSGKTASFVHGPRMLVLDADARTRAAGHQAATDEVRSPHPPGAAPWPSSAACPIRSRWNCSAATRRFSSPRPAA